MLNEVEWALCTFFWGENSPGTVVIILGMWGPERTVGNVSKETYVPQGERSCSPRIALSSVRRIVEAQWMLVEWIDGRWKSRSLNEWTNKWFSLPNKPGIQEEGEKIVGKPPKWGISCERLRVWTLELDCRFKSWLRQVTYLLGTSISMGITIVPAL